MRALALAALIAPAAFRLQGHDLDAGPGPTKSRATIRTIPPHRGWSFILGR